MSPYKLSILLFHLFHSCQSHDLGRLPCTSGNNLRLYDMELPYGRWSSAVAGKTSSWKRINTEWHSGPSQLSPYAIQSVDVSNSSGVKLIPEALQEASHFISLCRNTRAFQVVLFHIERIGRIGLDELLGLVHLEVLNLHRNYGTR
jgi:hypothetical protein